MRQFAVLVRDDMFDDWRPVKMCKNAYEANDQWSALRSASVDVKFHPEREHSDAARAVHAAEQTRIGYSDDGTTWTAPEKQEGMWIWDCVENHPITLATRIPIVEGPYSRWAYHVALALPDKSKEFSLYDAIDPTEEEIAQLASYLEYFVTSWYYPHYVRKMRELPIDLDSGVNTITFIKRKDAGWGYNRRTWTSGPSIFPSFNDEKNRMNSLLELLDHVNTFGGEPSPKWVAWKAEHPEVFAVENAA